MFCLSCVYSCVFKSQIMCVPIGSLYIFKGFFNNYHKILVYKNHVIIGINDRRCLGQISVGSVSSVLSNLNNHTVF